MLLISAKTLEALKLIQHLHKSPQNHAPNRAKKGLITVPHPNKDLPIKTAKSILKQAGLKLGGG
ncbi:type II toxin-antitoxin system HicA family toxin [Phosphitispora sp. TUW77]|uniref:type II toxin-antitoxin system HicA family toxin n=1 Tax=Phosphitispora sp. TUW77 TaxID=3152361 RepID=UPI003AB6C6FD